MKSSEIKQKPEKELRRTLKENRKKLQQFYFDLALGKAKNVRKIRRTKKDIAKILTIIKLKK